MTFLSYLLHHQHHHISPDHQHISVPYFSMFSNSKSCKLVQLQHAEMKHIINKYNSFTIIIPIIPIHVCVVYKAYKKKKKWNQGHRHTCDGCGAHLEQDGAFRNLLGEHVTCCMSTRFMILPSKYCNISKVFPSSLKSSIKHPTSFLLLSIGSHHPVYHSIKKKKKNFPTLTAHKTLY